MDLQELRKLQLKELEILNVIKDICYRNNIKFSLYAGSALGAARHGGFIPWDDDLDIMMNREDYNKFLNLCKKELPKNYFLQNYHTDKEFTQTFSKIRDNNTIFVEAGTENINMNRGVFIDIFPIDIVPNNRLKRFNQYINGCINLLLARRKPSKKDGYIIYIICKIILTVIPEKYHYSILCFSEREKSKYCEIDGENLIDSSTFYGMKILYKNKVMKDITYTEFEGLNIPIISEYDKYLKQTYGNYMEFPPEEERICKHNPIICDLNKSYKEFGYSINSR